MKLVSSYEAVVNTLLSLVFVKIHPNKSCKAERMILIRGIHQILYPLIFPPSMDT